MLVDPGLARRWRGCRQLVGVISDERVRCLREESLAFDVDLWREFGLTGVVDVNFDDRRGGLGRRDGDLDRRGGRKLERSDRRAGRWRRPGTRTNLFEQRGEHRAHLFCDGCLEVERRLRFLRLDCGRYLGEAAAAERCDLVLQLISLLPETVNFL